MTKKTKTTEYYCVAVQRNYEPIWRFVSQHSTQEEAQHELEERRGYTGAFNYNNARLRVVSRTQAKQEFGSDWEYVAIGAAKPKAARKA